MAVQFTVEIAVSTDQNIDDLREKWIAAERRGA
jgi:hypothetical protein